MNIPIMNIKDEQDNWVPIPALIGETGESGVYIGDSEPDDPKINVWIDTSQEESIIPAQVITYTNPLMPGVTNVKEALDFLASR